MRKGDVIAEAVEAIPLWLAFLDRAEAEQRKMLEEIQQAAQAEREMPAPIAVSGDAADSGPDPNTPLGWLDHTAPPPKEEAQAPVTAVPEPTKTIHWQDTPPPLDGDDSHIVYDDDPSPANGESVPPWEKE